MDNTACQNGAHNWGKLDVVDVLNSSGEGSQYVEMRCLDCGQVETITGELPILAAMCGAKAIVQVSDSEWRAYGFDHTAEDGRSPREAAERFQSRRG